MRGLGFFKRRWRSWRQDRAARKRVRAEIDAELKGKELHAYREAYRQEQTRKFQERGALKGLMAAQRGGRLRGLGRALSKAVPPLERDIGTLQAPNILGGLQRVKAPDLIGLPKRRHKRKRRRKR